MAYDFSTRLDTLGTRMKELHQNSLTYRRTGYSDITISNFTPERVDVSQLAQFGITLVTEQAQDFIFDTSDLSTLTPAVPVEGDQLIWNGATYQVMSLNDELYNFTTSTEQRIRVHAKDITSNI